MKTRPLHMVVGRTAWVACALLLGVPTAGAQYMFLDVDGDGVYTYVDTYPPGGSVHVDVYLVTNQNFDGSPAVCAQDGSEININSYAVNLYARDAAVSFTDVTNHMAGMGEVDPPVIYPYAISVAFAGFQSFPAGKYRLLSLTATFAAGCPALDIVPYSCYSPPGLVTSFGSNCPGIQGDYTLRLGEDLQEALGMGCTDLGGRRPSLSCPGEVVGVEGQPIAIPVTLTDPDCDIFSYYAYGLPPGATFSGFGPFVAGDASGTVSWTPAIGQAGSYAIGFDASDYPNPFQMITLRDTCTTLVTIRATTSASFPEDDDEITTPIVGGLTPFRVSVSPNPLGAGSVLELTTSATGAVSAWLFDIRGRRVATLVNGTAVPGGYHRIPLAGLEQLRARLASGVYFVRIATERDGTAIRRVTILR